MRAILIDPFTQSVTEIDLPSTDDGVDLDAMYKVMDCDCLDLARVQVEAEELICYIDDNGLFRQKQAHFLIDGRAIAGKTILLSRNEIGESAAVASEIAEVSKSVQWITERYAKATLEMQTQAAVADAVAHGMHVEAIVPYGFLSATLTNRAAQQ